MVMHDMDTENRLDSLEVTVIGDLTCKKQGKRESCVPCMEAIPPPQPCTLWLLYCLLGTDSVVCSRLFVPSHPFTWFGLCESDVYWGARTRPLLSFQMQDMQIQGPDLRGLRCLLLLPCWDRKAEKVLASAILAVSKPAPTRIAVYLPLKYIASLRRTCAAVGVNPHPLCSVAARAFAEQPPADIVSGACVSASCFVLLQNAVASAVWPLRAAALDGLRLHLAASTLPEGLPPIGVFEEAPESSALSISFEHGVWSPLLSTATSGPLSMFRLPWDGPRFTPKWRAVTFHSSWMLPHHTTAVDDSLRRAVKALPLSSAKLKPSDVSDFLHDIELFRDQPHLWMLGLVPPTLYRIDDSTAQAFAAAGLAIGRLCWYLLRRLQAAQSHSLRGGDVPPALARVISDSRRSVRFDPLNFELDDLDQKYAEDEIAAQLDLVDSDDHSSAVALQPVFRPRTDSSPDDDDELGFSLPVVDEVYRAPQIAAEPPKRSKRRGWWKDAP